MVNYNKSVKSLFEVFSEYNNKYVRIAALSFAKEKNSFDLLERAFGPDFDGKGRELISSYIEQVRLKNLLTRVESRIKVVQVLIERERYSAEKILKIFYTKKDAEILAFTRELLNGDNSKEEKLIKSKELLLARFNISEKVLSSALDYIDDNAARLIYIYYYGIERTKLPLYKIIGIYPEYNETKIKHLLLEIQKQIPELLMRVPEDTNTATDVVERTINDRLYSKLKSKHNSFFEYCYNEGDTIEIKIEKKRIVLDFIDNCDSKYVDVISKIFDSNYSSLNSDIELTSTEKGIFKKACDMAKEYVDRIYGLRRRSKKGHILDTDRIFHADINLNVRLLDYLKTGRVDVVRKNNLKTYLNEYFNNNVDVERFISRFYNLDTLRLYPNIYVSNRDIDEIKNKFKDIKVYIDKREQKCEYPSKFIDYFVNNKMSDNTKMEVNRLMLEYINRVPSLGEKFARRLWGENFDCFNVDIEITDDDKIYLDSLISGINNYLDKNLKKENLVSRKKTTKKNFDSFLDYFIDSNLSEQGNNDIRKRAKDIIDQSKIKNIVIKYYGPDYDKRNSIPFAAEDKAALSDLRKRIRDKIANPFNFKNTFLSYFMRGHLSDKTKNDISRLFSEYMASTNHPGKMVVIKIFGNNYNTLNKDVKLNADEISLLTEFIDLIREYIHNNVEHPKEENKLLSDYFFDFLVTDKENVFEMYGNIFLAQEYLEKNSSKYVEIGKRLYGDDFGKLKNENVSEEDKEQLLLLRKEIKDYIKKEKSYDIEFKPKFIDYFDDLEVNIDKEMLTARLVFNLNVLKPSASDIIIKVYGESLDQFNEYSGVIHLNNKLSFFDYIRNTKKTLNTKPLIDFGFKEDFLSYFYEKIDNRSDLVAKVNNYLEKIDDSCVRIIRYCYNEDFKLKKNTPVSESELNHLNKIIKHISRLIEIENNKAKCDLKDKRSETRGLLKLHFLDYFKLPGEEEVPQERIDIIMIGLNKSESKYKAILQDIYGEDYSDEAKYRKVNKSERSGIASLIKQLKNLSQNKKFYSKFSLATNFKTQFYLPNDTDETKDDIDKIVFDYLGSRKIHSHDIIKEIYDEDYNLKGSPELDYNQKNCYRRLIKSIDELVQNYRNGVVVEKKVRKQKNLKEYFFDYFITDDMPLVDIVRIPYIYELYSMRQRSDSMSCIREVYDENYHLRKDITITDEMIRRINSFRNYFKKYVLRSYLNKYVIPNEHIKKHDNDVSKVYERVQNIDMMDLGMNSDLVLKNDLFELEMIFKYPPVVEKNYPTEVIMNTYLEVNDSKTVMELLQISEETLLNFYLDNLEKFEEVTEALRFIIYSGNKDAIKRLFVTPLFLNVVNNLSDQERQVLYLKLVQVRSDAITDEVIARITNVPIELVREYVIMTREESINELNDYIRKVHK